MGQGDSLFAPFRHTVWDKGTVPLSHTVSHIYEKSPLAGLFSLARVSVAFWLVGAVGAGAGAAARGIGGTAAHGPAAGADDQVHRLAGIKLRSA